jgi:RNA polymerase sigma factor (sigma-70 family)
MPDANGAETMTMTVLEAAGTGPGVPATRDRSLSELEAAASVFVTARPRLFGIALRVVGDVDEAEDVVQEAWIRWERADRSGVASPSAFLALTTTRLAINVLQSARKRRETCAGRWLAEAVERSAGPQATVECQEEVTDAVRLLLARLTPAERAAYLLRRAFEYPYRRISEVLGLEADHARQLVRRATERISAGRDRPVDAAAHGRLVQVFLAAARTGNLADLEELLAADVVRQNQRRRPRLSQAAGVPGLKGRPQPSRRRARRPSSRIEWPMIVITKTHVLRVVRRVYGPDHAASLAERLPERMDLERPADARLLSELGLTPDRLFSDLGAEL